jgi:hypothetical protein
MKCKAGPAADAPDPILSFEYIVEDLGISRATFHRVWRHMLPVVEISERRRGVRRSDYEAAKAARIRPGRAA